MKIGLRILLGYFLIVGLSAWFLLNVAVDEVKPGVRASQEDTLVDTAHLLAEMAAPDVKGGALTEIAPRMREYARRSVTARINGIAKQHLDYRVYITDARGIVLFDTTGADVGKDYSRWNDVYLTLRGKYGVRSTRSDPNNENSTVMHVAAPILDPADRSRIIGVLTVAKPNASVQAFIERGQRIIMRWGIALLVLSLLVGIAFAWWLARALRRLMDYVADVEAGRKAALPRLGNNEIATLGQALEAMRSRLEGKEYAERLMHTLAHELKSPIAAIQVSAELLQEPMPDGERQRFLANILEQNTRQKQLIDKLLALVRVEQQQRLEQAAPVELRALCAAVAGDFAGALAARGVRLAMGDAGGDGDGKAGSGPGLDAGADAVPLVVEGDALLLRQALGNLLDNAIGFAPVGSVIRILPERRDGQAVIAVCDSGPGIPAYAQERLFERFYSLPRPDGAKSTGLGLPFVREVAALHGGEVKVANARRGGCCAELVLPLPLAL
ncbi:two-component system sensor histidine kinase CreC [Pseudoduganella ginsengisoli]|uniref:histidine kinase n=1 Tax=Pseudoduganella ginsengisoli TaxID=1462440 RepID=A0A6L6Q2V9_9BURK|nr:two-component system sensor histidine kinase CreC [Pseudoduganella ginsengisoli]MTW03651.1 two-component system sensor histidine kinase CreC [Pseudoduganella ginsengisoli]